MVRHRLPRVLSAKETLNISPKTDDDVSMGQMMEDQVRIKKNEAIVARGGAASINWAPVLKIFESVKREDLSKKIAESLLQSPSRLPQQVIDNFVDAASREEFIKTTIINLMSTPEYQLC